MDAATTTILVPTEALATASDVTGTDFQGWYYSSDSARAITCPTPQSFSITSPYADCLQPDATAVATACEDNVLLYDDDTSFVCDTTVSCVTMTVSATSSSGAPVVTRYMCANDWFYNTIYREQIVPVTTTTEGTTTASTTTSSRSTSTLASPTSTSSTDTASSNNESSSLSGGAIAGIVVGCAAAIIIIALVFLRKKISALFRKPNSQEPMSEMLDSNEIYEIGTSVTGPLVKGKDEPQEIGGSVVKKNDEVQEIGVGK